MERSIMSRGRTFDPAIGHMDPPSVYGLNTKAKKTALLGGLALPQYY